MKKQNAQDAQFEALYAKANAAGEAAAKAMTPTPVAFQMAKGLDDGFDWNRPYDVVADGVCGFAWINIRPASPKGQKDHPFVRYLRSIKVGRYESYAKAYQIWIGGYNQSMQRKEAHAEAMAKVLQEAGISAYAQSRMD